jgi:transposase
MLMIPKPLSAGQAQSYHAREFVSKEQSYWSRDQQGFSEWQGQLAKEWGLSIDAQVLTGSLHIRVDLYEVFNAVLYLLKSGCQWRMLPEGFPKWCTVYSHFAKWREPDQDGTSALERALKKSVGEAREKLGLKATTSFIIVDAQSVKNTDKTEEKGCDADKKVSGIKRHVAVDTQGLPHAVAATTADVADRNDALAAIDRCKPNLESVESVLVDGGYPFKVGRLFEKLDYSFHGLMTATPIGSKCFVFLVATANPLANAVAAI